MKTRKHETYRANADVLKIDCGLHDADIIIKNSTQSKLYIEYTKNLHPFFAESDGIVTLRQLKKPFFNFKRPSLTIFVPECNVPDVRVNIEKGCVLVCGGFYRDANIFGGKIKAEICNSSFENLIIKAKELVVAAENITVKNIANASAADGSLKFDNTFCKKAECRVKKGNIGLCSCDCDFASLNSGEGNIAAHMLGTETNYAIDLESNAVREKRNISETGKTIRARAINGNVVLDFENSSDETQESQEKETTCV